MKPLAEIVAEIEADKRAGYPLEIPKADLLRLCAAFRAAEKIAQSYQATVETLEEIDPDDQKNIQSCIGYIMGAPIDEWDRVTGGDE